jgi:hypothetical protein
MNVDPINWLGRALRKTGTEILRRRGTGGTWIDVVAHNGELTLGCAIQNPGLRVYAFEPNLRAAASLIGRVANFISGYGVMQGGKGHRWN